MIFFDDIKISLDVLKKGGILLYPTDTIWGIGCDATNERAVNQVYRIKQRELSKSLIILVGSMEMLSNYVETIPNMVIKLIKKTKNPLTVIYQNAKNLSKNVLAEDGSVAIRIPNDEFCLELIKAFGKPIVSTSANISEEPAPKNFSQIKRSIMINMDYVVKWKQNDLTENQPSTIVMMEETGNITYLRK